jgi:hypothetical protein
MNGLTIPAGRVNRVNRVDRVNRVNRVNQFIRARPLDQHNTNSSAELAPFRAVSRAPFGATADHRHDWPEGIGT